MATALDTAKKSKFSKRPPREPTWDIAYLYPMQGDWTENDYLTLEANSGNRMIELVNGRIEFPPMPDMFHQDIVKFLLFRLHDFVVPHFDGEVLHAPLPVRLGKGVYREPDIAYFKPHRIKDRCKPPEGADLVMEVVSPGKDARQRDLKDKRADYAKAKIPEYWIVDPETRTITVLTLSGRTYKIHGEFKAGEQAAS
jgi:Uma2 family endonuclease